MREELALLVVRVGNSVQRKLFAGELVGASSSDCHFIRRRSEEIESVTRPYDRLSVTTWDSASSAASRSFRAFGLTSQSPASAFRWVASARISASPRAASATPASGCLGRASPGDPEEHTSELQSP